MTQDEFEQLSETQKVAAFKLSGDKISIIFDGGEEVHTYPCIRYDMPSFVFESKEDRAEEARRKSNFLESERKKEEVLATLTPEQQAILR